jgi:hypothetical protein
MLYYRYMKYSFWLLAFGTLAISSNMSSCRSAKKIQTAAAKKDTTVVVPVMDKKPDSTQYFKQVYNAVNSNRVTNFQTFSAKVRVEFKGASGKKPDFTANIRMKKDSIIWITVPSILGEALRAVVTKDSIKVLYKIPDKYAQLRSIEYLKELTQIPFSFNELQDLLMGNPIYLDSNIVSYKNEERQLSLMTVSTLFKHLLTVSKDGFLPTHSKLDDVDVLRARTCDIIYSDYELKNGMNFSKYRKIVVSEKTKLEIELQFKQFDFNTQLDFPFKIPKNYKLQ